MSADLASWLLEQIAEDERDARVIQDCEYFHGVESDAEPQVLRFSDPARVLAECEAKRKIIELHPEDHSLCSRCSTFDFEYQSEYVRFPCPTLRCLALPFADRPGYQEEWRP